MRTSREKFEVTAWTLLRLTVGVIFVVHGWGKLTDVSATAEQFAGMGIPAADALVWLAIAGEFLGGLGLIVGALTPIAAFGTFCTMAVAILAVHIENGLLAQNGGFEYPLTMLVVSLAFIARGAGPISVDAWVKSMRNNRMDAGESTGRPWSPNEPVHAH